MYVMKSVGTSSVLLDDCHFLAFVTIRFFSEYCMNKKQLTSVYPAFNHSPYRYFDKV